MKVQGKSTINQLSFKDLKSGDVFCFTKDITSNIENVKVYLRGGHTSTDKTAINLETGIMYTFEDTEPVKIVSGTLIIKDEEI